MQIFNILHLKLGLEAWLQVGVNLQLESCQVLGVKVLEAVLRTQFDHFAQVQVQRLSV